MTSLSPAIWNSWETLLPIAWPPFVTMWLLAVLLFAAIKIALLQTAKPLAPLPSFCFLALWPGMDLKPFYHRARPILAPWHAWLPGLICLAAGLILLSLAAKCPPLLGGALGMLAIILTLHFGLFDLLALAFRRLGVAVRPIMGNPFAVTSLTKFWGGTWNRAFTDAVYPFLVRPLTKRYGATPAIYIAFVISALAHELVISIPAGAGHGGPTLYFILQALGMQLERRWRRQGRLFLLPFVVLPVPLLFHPPFLENVIHPFTIFITHILTLP